MWSRHTWQMVLQGLVGPLRLTVGLRMIPRREARFRPESCAEGSPNLGDKLRTSVGHDIPQDAVNAEDVLDEEIPRPRSWGELGQCGDSQSFGRVLLCVEKRSTTVGIVWPSEGGRPGMKSHEIVGLAGG